MFERPPLLAAQSPAKHRGVTVRSNPSKPRVVQVRSTNSGLSRAMEKEVVRALLDGLRSREIATRIKRSRATVETYVRILRAKYGARSRLHLIAKILRADRIR